MYEREMAVKMVKMIEKGSGWKTVGKFELDGIEEAIQLAETESGWGKQVLLAP